MKYVATSGWTQMGDSINGHFEGEQFGSSVQLSRDGETLVVGGMGFVDVDGDQYGHVTGYQYNSYTDKWKQNGESIQGEYKADRFGISLSMASDGMSWIVGADSNRKDLFRRQRDGYARIFHLRDGKWEQKGRTIHGSNGSWTGYAVAMSGNGKTICVGDRLYQINTNFIPGRARCYKWSGWPDLDWKAISVGLVGEFHKEQSGYSLSLNEDGTVLAVSSAKYESGSVRVYSLVGAVWEMMGERLTGDKNKDQMGFRVSLNRKGDVLAYAGHGYDGQSMDNVGVVRVRRWVNNTWTPLGEDITGYDAGDHLGACVALDDDGMVLVFSANSVDAEYANAFILA